MQFPSKVLAKAVEEMAQLPGIGKRTALRLVLHLLKNPKSQTENLAEALYSLVNNIQYCKQCHTISDREICEICADESRNKNLLCIVEDVRDVMAIENTQHYNGLYHVLGGKISPLDGVSPQQLFIDDLVQKTENSSITEIIFALSSTLEGDTTAFYIHKKLKHLSIKFTTIARGISIGDELQYADELTLVRSLENRILYTI